MFMVLQHKSSNTAYINKEKKIVDLDKRRKTLNIQLQSESVAMPTAVNSKVIYLKQENADLEGGEIMDENKILELYINKVDTDQADLRTEMRDREKRFEDYVKESEKRVNEKISSIDDKFSLIESMISKQTDAINDMKISSLKETNKLKQNISEKLDEHKKWYSALVLSTILAIAAMVISIIVTMK